MFTDMVKHLSLFVIMALVIVFCAHKTHAEEIHFNNTKYILKYSVYNPECKGYMNEYFPENETPANWTQMVGIYYYEDEKSPIKFAQQMDKNIESADNSVLIKFIENKKQDKAVISFLVNNTENGRNYFEYNIYKYEKHPDKGTMMLKFAQKYYCTTDSEITTVGNKVRDENDKYMEQLITSPIPPVIKKEINP